MKKIITLPRYIVNNNDLRVIFENILKYKNEIRDGKTQSVVLDKYIKSNTRNIQAKLIEDYKYELVRFVRKLNNTDISMLTILYNVLKYNTYVNKLSNNILIPIIEDIIKTYYDFYEINKDEIKNIIADYNTVYTTELDLIYSDLRLYTEITNSNNEIVYISIDDYLVKELATIKNDYIGVFNNKLNTILIGKLKTYMDFTTLDNETIRNITALSINRM